MGTVCKVLSVAPIGFEGHIVEVESDMTKGLPGVQIVGLGNKAIDEAKERVKSAIANSLLEYPAKRVTINLAPAELPKTGHTMTCQLHSLSSPQAAKSNSKNSLMRSLQANSPSTEAFARLVVPSLSQRRRATMAAQRSFSQRPM